MRQWVYDTIREDSEFQSFFGDRLFQSESLDGAPATKPFAVYNMGNASPDNDVYSAERQYFSVWLHDSANPGVYEDNIDPGVAIVQRIFRDAPPAPEYKILEARYLETSKDLDDREMRTILRYVRFQLILSER